jgi:predicted SAM-dependent methyltransferase
MLFRCLEIGANETPIVQDIYNENTVEGAEVEIVQLDANPDAPHVDVVHELSYPDAPLPFEDEHFDAIMASHILEHIPYHMELHAMKDWHRALKVGGTLHVVVPSAEFIARTILSEKSTKYIKPYAIGGLVSPWDVHVNLFTMQMLRSLFQYVGFNVVRARVGPRVIQSLDDPEYMVEQHYISGVKIGEQS